MYFIYNPTNKCKVGFGADGFALNSNILNNIKLFYDQCMKLNNNLFYHDDLVISKYLSIHGYNIEKLKVKKGDKLIYDQLVDISSLNKLDNELSRYNLNKIKIDLRLFPRTH